MLVYFLVYPINLRRRSLGSLSEQICDAKYCNLHSGVVWVWWWFVGIVVVLGVLVGCVGWGVVGSVCGVWNVGVFVGCVVVCTSPATSKKLVPGCG